MSVQPAALKKVICVVCRDELAIGNLVGRFTSGTPVKKDNILIHQVIIQRVKGKNVLVGGIFHNIFQISWLFNMTQNLQWGN